MKILFSFILAVLIFMAITIVGLVVWDEVQFFVLSFVGCLVVTSIFS